MRIGIVSNPSIASVDEIREEVDFANDAGVHTYWLGQIHRFDAITLIPSLAERAERMEFGTGVVAIYHRHPMTLASEALTASALTGGRFTLGIGLMHGPVIEQMFEMSFDHPVRRMREYLDVLIPLLAQEPVSVSGETVSFHGQVEVPNAAACPLMLAALGPQMLRLCGGRTSGTITYMTGPKTLRDHIVPILTAAAERADRPEPRVVAYVPVHVTDDVESAKSRAAELLGMYGYFPSYRAMLDKEGWAGAEDAAVIGDEAYVQERLDEYATSGVTDIGLAVLPAGDDRERTRALIRSLTRMSEAAIKERQGGRSESFA